MKKFLFLLCSLLFSVVGAWATTPGTLSSTTQITAADQFADGKLYAVRVNSGSYITESDGQYVAPNAQNTITDEALYSIVPNADGETFTVCNYATHNYWGELTGSAVDGTFIPSAEAAGWTFTFNGSNVQASSGGFYINRSSGVMHGWTTGINLQIYEVNNIEVNFVTALDELSNNKCYVVYNQRAAWNVADEATSANAIALDVDAVSERFALINYNDAYYIYSVNAKAFLTSANTLGDPEAVTIVDSGVEGYPFFFKFDDSHNINVSGGRMFIDSWTEVDAGNANAIIEAADFDPFEAIVKIDPSTAEVYTGLQLTFDRTGTGVADVAVKVADQDGNALKTVTATLVASSITSFRNAGAEALTRTENSVLAPAGGAGYSNTQGDQITYTFRINNLNADFAYNTAVVDVYALNGGGTAQNSDGTCIREWTIGVETGAAEDALATFVEQAGNDICTVEDEDGGLHHKAWEIAAAEAQTATAPLFVKVTLTKTAELGCFAGIGAVELKNTETEPVKSEAYLALEQEIANAEALLAAAEKEDGKEEFQAAINTAMEALVLGGDDENMTEALATLQAAEEAFAAAQEDTETTIEILVDKGHGTYYNASGNALTDTGWGASWISTENDPGLTLTATSGINVANGMHFGPAGVTYTLMASEGYHITGYALTASNLPDGSSVLTPEGGEDQSFEVNVPNTVSNLDTNTTTFVISVGRAQISKFVVYLKKLENVPEPAVFAYGKYIVKNVGSGLYWGAGNDWGTRASLIKNPEFLKFDPTDMPEGQYKLESQVNNGGTAYYFNGDYMDNGSPVALTITKLENGNYTIAKAEDGTLYGYDGTSTVLGKGLTDADDANAQWDIQTLDAAKAALANATVEAPMNATLLLDDPNFGRNNRYVNKWTMEASNKNLSGGNNTNNCAESYHSEFTLTQTVEAPNGLYAVTAQGFYRQDGTDNDNLPVFYANDEPATFPLKIGSENSMSDASVSFTNGLYTIDPIYVEVTDGQLSVGAKLTGNTSLWCIWDNFELKYYGADADINAVKFGALIAQVEELRVTVQSLQDAENISDAANTELATALSETENVEQTEGDLTVAIEKLTTAIDHARGAIEAAPKLAAANRLMESTNVYTAEAYETYKAIVDDIQQKYDAGTLTLTEAASFVNPEVVAGWHSANAFDDLLLSAWTINDVQCNDFATALYINTWSVEGETDGTNFKVPFFEYWTGDANSLGASALTATMTGLEAGNYEVEAWVRVRAKNGINAADATGITLSVNDDDAVDVTEGEALGQFNLAKYTATGVVGEDGVLIVKFDVSADNNISWLSFKNVKYTKILSPYEAALATIEDGKTYRVFTEKDGQKYYLNTSGYLVAEAQKAATFTFTAVKADGTLYETGWNLGCKFTNPGLTGGSTGDIVNDGHIHVGGNDRNDWERQVLFLESGNYAVRSTNANSANWGANTYWDVFDGAELPEAGYSLEPAYVWQIEEFVDNRPDILANLNLDKVQAWAEKLQKVEGLVTDASQFSSNAKESSEGSYEALLDGEYTTFFHSQWSGTGPDEDHYLQAEIEEPVTDIFVYFKKRSQNDNNRPTEILISASNDGENFVDITTITEGLPTGATPIDYISDKISLGETYKYIRFTVPSTNNNAKNNGHVFFTFSEFYLLPASEVIEAAIPYMNIGAYTDLDFDADAEAINAAIEAIDALIAEKEALKILAEEVEAFKVSVDKVQAYVDATETYEDTNNAAAKATAALKELKDAEYTSLEAVEEAKAKLNQIAVDFFGAIKAVTEIDITDIFIVNPAPMTIDGWEGDAFGTASNGVCEYWNKAAASFHQNVSLPAGRYKLTAIALTRTDMEGKLYADNRSTNIATIDNSTVNNRAQAGAWFDAGNGVNELTFTVKEAGDVEIGLKADANTGDHWIVWRSFALTLIPDAEVEGYVVSEAYDYGHWYRAEVDGDSIAYSFAFNNTYKSADKVLQVQVTNAETDSLLNHVNKGVFVLNEGFRINSAGERYVQKFTLTVPRDYEIVDYKIDNSIPGAARGVYKYSLNKDMSDAVLIGATETKMYESIITETVGGTRQCVFYLEPLLPDDGGSVIDVVFTVNVREIDVDDIASVKLATAKYDGTDITFDENGNATVDAEFDAEKALEITPEDENAEVIKVLPAEDGNEVIITVKGADSNYDPENVAVYTITFNPVAQPIQTAIEAVAAEPADKAIYDLSGRRVSKAVKGIYIINGKKVVK